MYKLQITKFIPRTDEELKEIKEARRYGRDFPISETYPNYMSREDSKTVRVLDVEITDEEFEAIKKGVIAIM